jgi:Uma2 family endonuclease
MSAAPEDAVWTLDDLMALPDDGRRHELLWGAIVMTPVPSARHADIVDDLAGRLRQVCPADQRVRANSGVVVRGTPVVNALGPDLYVARRDALADPYVSAADVLLVVEVSLSTFRRDMTAKAAAYAEGGIPWCWLLSSDLSLEVRRLAGSSYEIAQVVRPGRAVEVLGPLPLSLDPGTLGTD